jgi:RimJ/RimL family protein N-acetyltransferase
MAHVTLVKHDLNFAEQIFELSSAAPVKDALGLNVEKIEDTIDFLHYIIEAEEEGREVSRVILNEQDQVIGVTSLMKIDPEKRRCHIGSWLGHEYWGKGYNDASKRAILDIAFNELNMEHVFAGARKVNIRSQKAQEKLPYIKLHVEEDFPEEHEWLEKKEKQECVLHAFYREDFLNYIYG